MTEKEVLVLEKDYISDLFSVKLVEKTILGDERYLSKDLSDSNDYKASSTNTDTEGNANHIDMIGGFLNEGEFEGGPVKDVTRSVINCTGESKVACKVAGNEFIFEKQRHLPSNLPSKFSNFSNFS